MSDWTKVINEIKECFDGSHEEVDVLYKQFKLCAEDNAELLREVNQLRRDGLDLAQARGLLEQLGIVLRRVSRRFTTVIINTPEEGIVRTCEWCGEKETHSPNCWMKMVERYMTEIQEFLK